MTGTTPQTAITTAPDSPPHADRRVALWSIIGFWAFYFVLNTARMAIESEHDQLSMLPRRGGVTVTGIAMTFVMYLILRRLEGKAMRVLVTAAFLISIPVSIAYAIVNYAAFYLIAPTASMLQEVTLSSSPEGQAGAPRIGRGVLLSAGATVLGNVDIGDFAKIGAGSLVLASVPSGYTAVGVPARLVGRASDARPALNMDQSLP